MSSEGNSLDLNNFPEDHTSPPYGGGGGGATMAMGKDEAGKKIYKCRFCSLKFCKSQALGGHMNRHRLERETETLNRARQLVFSNHVTSATTTQINFIPSGNGGYPQSDSNAYPGRMHTNSRFIPPPPRLASLHPSPPHILSFFTSRHAVAPPPGIYFVDGRVLTSPGFGVPADEAQYGLASGDGIGWPRSERHRGDCGGGELSLYYGSNSGPG